MPLPLPGKGKSSSAKQKDKGLPSVPIENPDFQAGPEAEPVSAYSNPFIDNIGVEENIFDIMNGIKEEVSEAAQNEIQDDIQVILDDVEDSADWLWDKIKAFFIGIYNFLTDNWFLLALLGVLFVVAVIYFLLKIFF